jgi:hypothetical protein
MLLVITSRFTLFCKQAYRTALVPLTAGLIRSASSLGLAKGNGEAV